MSPTRPRRRTRRTVVLLAVTAAAVAAAVVLVPRLSAGPSTAGSTSAAGTTAAGSSAGAARVTAGKARVGDVAATSTAPFTIKPEPSTVATDKPVPTATDGTAPVVLSYVGYQSDSRTVQANGFVSGLIEDGGTCTLVLTRNGVRVTATSTSSSDATTTSCGLLETAPGLAAGTWQAVLQYSSAKAHGTSTAQQVTVQ